MGSLTLFFFSYNIGTTWNERVARIFEINVNEASSRFLARRDFANLSITTIARSTQTYIRAFLPRRVYLRYGVIAPRVRETLLVQNISTYVFIKVQHQPRLSRPQETMLPLAHLSRNMIVMQMVNTLQFLFLVNEWRLKRTFKRRLTSRLSSEEFQGRSLPNRWQTDFSCVTSRITLCEK